MVRTTVVNSYPKISSVRGEVNLRNAINRRETGKIDDAELENIYKETIKRTIREQEEAGLDIITDGLIRWDDPVSPFCRHVRNLNRGGLLRFFDNNVYYRRPTVDGELSVISSSTVDQYVFATKHCSVPVKVVLPGPVTFRNMCEDRYYGDDDRFFGAIGEILDCEVKALTAAGCREIQFDEPSLPFYPEQADKSVEIINGMSRNAGARLTVFFYFGKLDPIRDSLKRYRVSMLGADCVSHLGNRGILLDSGSDCTLCFGLVDSRDLKLESQEAMLAEMESVEASLEGRDFWISPSCSLEFLPHDYALSKLKLLGDVARTFNKSR